ncbi:MAG: thrombospondin type 3 repeat-containing protein, partial [Chloroflexota bacterium]
MSQQRSCLVLFGALVIAILFIAAAIAIVLLSPRVTHPSVLINSPRNATRVSVGQDTIIQAIARDDQKIKRVELWVDDKLQDAQDTNVSGGISPFPLTMTWRPTISGTHTVVVRAFNSEGARSHATISVQALASADRDGDGVLDSRDACPDQPGTEAARGCPDRDGDGVRDADDACPAQAGLPTQRGCPAPSAQDRDGDGLRDSADACPDQPGSPGAQGCPDADGDGVRDSADACPREPGDAQNGCPTPGDADGDGVPDASDACPRAPGRP